MKINKLSLHYRFNKWYVEDFGNRYWSKPTSLCAYFWHTVFNSLKICLFWLCVIGIGGFIFGFMLGKSIYVGLILDLNINLYPVTGWEYLFIPLIGWGFSALVLLVTVGIPVWLQLKRELNNKPDGLTVSYLKAKKEKICPMIDWSDSL